MPIDPSTLETYRQRLLALQQHIVQRIFDLEASMLDMDADRDIERTDRVQEEAAEVTLTALDEQGRREMEAIQAALARLDAGTYFDCLPRRLRTVVYVSSMEAVGCAVSSDKG